MKKLYSVYINIVFCFTIVSLIPVISGCDDSGSVTNSDLRTVRGRVVDDYGGPISSATVSCLTGGVQTTSTSSDGAFAIGNVKIPYDLYLIYQGRASVYKGIKSLSPLLNTFGNTSNFENQARINLNVPAINSDQRVVAWFNDTTEIHQGDTTSTNGGNIGFNVGWEGVNVIVGRVMVMVYTLNNDVPVRYDNYGEKPAALVNQGICTITFSPDDISTDPIDTALSCVINMPAGASTILNQMYISTKPYYNYTFKGFYLYGSDGASQNYNIIVPYLENKFYYNLQTNTTGDNNFSNKVSQIQPGTNSITLNNPTVLINPPNGANNINYTTEFSFFSDNSDGLYRTIFKSDSSSGYFLNVISKVQNTNIPDLTFLGYDPDLQKTYTWQVVKYSNLNNIDDFVLSSFKYSPLIKSVSASETRTFRFSTSPSKK